MRKGPFKYDGLFFGLSKLNHRNDLLIKLFVTFNNIWSFAFSLERKQIVQPVVCIYRPPWANFDDTFYNHEITHSKISWKFIGIIKLAAFADTLFYSWSYQIVFFCVHTTYQWICHSQSCFLSHFYVGGCVFVC